MADAKIEYRGKVTNVKAGEKAVLRCEYMTMEDEVIVEACETVVFEPTETIRITENTKEGEPLDVTMAKEAIVAVPPPKDYMPIPTETLPINTLGEKDVTNYAKVDVKAPDGYVLPAGMVTITENTKKGERLTISPFKYLRVNVPPPDDYMPIPSEDDVLNIGQNNNGIDVLHYSKVNVHVPVPEGYVKPSDIPLEIKENTAEGETVDVTYRKNVVVNVPIPEGYVLPEGKYTAERNTAEGELIPIENYKYLEVKVPEIEAPAAPNLIPLTVIPSTQVQEEKPSGEVDGFSSVKVEAIPIATMDQPITSNGPVDAPEGKYFTHLDVEVPIPEGYFKPEGIYHADRNTNGNEKIPIGEYEYLTVAVTNEPFLTSKTVTPTKTGQIVMPGYYNELLGVKYDGLSQVTVNPVPTESLKGDNAIKENGSYTPSEGKFFDEVEVNVQPKLQSKSVTPTTEAQTVTPDNNAFLGLYFDGLSSVTVNPIPDNYMPTPTETLFVNSPGDYDVKDYANVKVSAITSDKLIFPLINGEKAVAFEGATWEEVHSYGLDAVYKTPIRFPTDTEIKRGIDTILMSDGDGYFPVTNISISDRYVQRTDTISDVGNYRPKSFPNPRHPDDSEWMFNYCTIGIPKNESVNAEDFESGLYDWFSVPCFIDSWGWAIYFMEANQSNNKVYSEYVWNVSSEKYDIYELDKYSDVFAHWSFIIDSMDRLKLRSKKTLKTYYALNYDGDFIKITDSCFNTHIETLSEG